MPLGSWVALTSLAPTGAPLRSIGTRSVHADGGTVVVVWDGQGRRQRWAYHSGSYPWIMGLAEGRVVDGTPFYDSISFDDLGTRVQP